MNCPHCNTYVEPYDRFCENCGAILTYGKDAPNPHDASTSKPEHAKTESNEPAPAAPFAPVPDVTPQAAAPFAPAPDATPQAAPSAEPVFTPYAQDAEQESAASSPEDSAQPKYSQPVYAAPVYEEPAPQPTYAPPAYEQPPEQPVYMPGYPTQPVSTPYANTNVAPISAFVMAIVSLVLGCIGLITFGVFGFLGIVGLILGILALVMRSGYAKRGLVDQRSGSTTVIGVFGIITNGLALAIFIILIAVVMAS